jgi:hypothetical protein
MSRLTLVENANAPTTPDADEVHIYAKTDGLLYSKSDNGLELALSPNGERAVDIVVTAGEVLSVRDFVFVDAVTGTAKKIDVDASTPLVGFIRGVVSQGGGITNGATGTVRISGEVTGFTGLTAWASLYASSTPGGYTQTKPSPLSGGAQVVVVPMGFATSATAMMVSPKTVTYLKRAITVNEGALTIVHSGDPQGRERRLSAYVSSNINELLAAYDPVNTYEGVTLGYNAYTSNIATGGTATASSFVGGFVASNAFNNNQNDVWVSNSPACWLRYDFGAGVTKRIGRYIIYSENGYPTRSPRNWTFEGSNDGTSWTALDTRTAQGPMTFSVPYTYSFANSVSYRYYRLNITTNNGDGAYSSISEFQMYEVTWKQKLTQSFQVVRNAAMSQVKVWLKKTGSPSNTITCTIETNNAGNPSGALVSASATATVAESSLSTSYGWVTFTFPANFSLSAGTTYWIVLSSPRLSDTDSVEWGANGAAGYPTGEMRYELLSTWYPENKDGCFQVYQIVSAIDEQCVVGRWGGLSRDVAARLDDGSGANQNTNTTFKNTSGVGLDLTVAVELA